jgi:hypothetical protein
MDRCSSKDEARCCSGCRVRPPAASLLSHQSAALWQQLEAPLWKPQQLLLVVVGLNRTLPLLPLLLRAGHPPRRHRPSQVGASRL